MLPSTESSHEQTKVSERSWHCLIAQASLSSISRTTAAESAMYERTVCRARWAR